MQPPLGEDLAQGRPSSQRDRVDPGFLGDWAHRTAVHPSSAAPQASSAGIGPAAGVLPYVVDG